MPDQNTTDKPSPAPGLFAVLTVVGSLLLLLLLLVLPFVLVIVKGWPWLGAEPSLIRPVGPEGLTTGTFWACVALLVASLLIRTVRLLKHSTKGANQATRDLIGAILALGAWYLVANSGLGSASYFIFSWITGHSAAIAVLYGLLMFLSGWSPGFFGTALLFQYIVFHDPRLLTVALLPAALGDVLEAALRPQKPQSQA